MEGNCYCLCMQQPVRSLFLLLAWILIYWHGANISGSRKRVLLILLISFATAIGHPPISSIPICIFGPITHCRRKSLGALVLLCYLSDVTTQEMIWLTCWGALHIKCWMGRYSYPKCNNGEKEHTNIILPSALHFPMWEQMNVMNIHSFAKQGCSFRSQESEWSPSGESTPLALRIHTWR